MFCTPFACTLKFTSRKSQLRIQLGGQLLFPKRTRLKNHSQFIDREERKEKATFARQLTVYRNGKQLEFSLNEPLSKCAREEGRILRSRL